MSCLHTKHRDTWHAALQDVHIPILILYFVYSFTEWSHHQSFASSCLLNFLGKIRRLLSIAGWDVKNPLRGTYFKMGEACILIGSVVEIGSSLTITFPENSWPIIFMHLILILFHQPIRSPRISHRCTTRKLLSIAVL